MILKGQLHHFFFQIPSLNENKTLPQRHQVEAPQLRPQSSEGKARALGTFGSSRMHSQGLRKACSAGTAGTKRSCQGAAGRCSLRDGGALQPEPAGQHVQLLCKPKTIQTRTQIFSGGSGLCYKGLCLR